MSRLRFMRNADGKARGLRARRRDASVLPTLHRRAWRAASLRGGARNQRALLRGLPRRHTCCSQCDGARDARGHARVARSELKVQGTESELSLNLTERQRKIPVTELIVLYRMPNDP